MKTIFAITGHVGNQNTQTDSGKDPKARHGCLRGAAEGFTRTGVTLKLLGSEKWKIVWQVAIKERP